MSRVCQWRAGRGLRRGGRLRCHGSTAERSGEQRRPNGGPRRGMGATALSRTPESLPVGMRPRPCSRLPMSRAPGAVLTRLDHSLLRATRRALGETPAVALAHALSHFGEHALGWITLGAVGWATGRRRSEWASAVVGVVAAHAAGVAVKRVTRRVRPDLVDVPALVKTPSPLSFPSAYSCSTAAAAVGFAPLVGRPVMVVATGAMSVSRVLLGVHYPTDVLSGAALGAAVAAAVRGSTAYAGRERQDRGS